MKNKAKILTEQIEQFEKSQRNVDDYIQLFSKVHITMKQGSGLDWVSVRDCISNAILNVDLENTLTNP